MEKDVFVLSQTWDKEKIFLYFFTEIKTLPSLLIYLQTWRYRHRWSQPCAGRVLYELRNRLRSPQSLCSSEVELRSADSAGLKFDSVWGLRFSSLSRDREKTKNIFLCWQDTSLNKKFRKFSKVLTLHISFIALCHRFLFPMPPLVNIAVKNIFTVKAFGKFLNFFN